MERSLHNMEGSLHKMEGILHHTVDRMQWLERLCVSLVAQVQFLACLMFQSQLLKGGTNVVLYYMLTESASCNIWMGGCII